MAENKKVLVTLSPELHAWIEAQAATVGENNTVANMIRTFLADLKREQDDA